MKKDLPPGVVAVVIILVFLVVGLLYWKGAGPRTKAEAIEDAIRATVIKGPINMPGGPSDAKMPPMPMPPAGKEKPSPVTIPPK